MRVKFAGILAMALAAAACQQSPGGSPTTQNPPGATQVSATCPRAGTIVETSTPLRLAYRGRDATDGAACIINNERSVGGIYIRPFVSDNSLPGVERSLRALLPFAPGRTAQSIGGAGAGFRHAFEVIGTREVVVPAGRFTVWEIRYVQEALSGTFRGEVRFFVDRDTGVLVKVDTLIISGTGNFGPSREATRIIPGGQ